MKTNFTIKKIKANIYLIKETYYKYATNNYLILGKDFNLLIDSGIGLKNIKHFIVSLGIKNIKVVLTHAHFDHFGGLQYFKPKDFIITEQVLQNIKFPHLWGLEYLDYNDIDAKIAAKEKTNKMLSNIRKKNFNQVTIVKSKIDLGDQVLNIIKTPGHTDDSVSFYSSEQKALFTGDTLFSGEPDYNLPNFNIKNWLYSLNHLKQLNFDLILPGHNQILNKKNAKQQIDAWLKILK